MNAIDRTNGRTYGMIIARDNDGGRWYWEPLLMDINYVPPRRQRSIFTQILTPVQNNKIGALRAALAASVLALGVTPRRLVK